MERIGKEKLNTGVQDSLHRLSPLKVAFGDAKNQWPMKVNNRTLERIEAGGVWHKGR